MGAGDLLLPGVVLLLFRPALVFSEALTTSRRRPANSGWPSMPRPRLADPATPGHDIALAGPNRHHHHDHRPRFALMPHKRAAIIRLRDSGTIDNIVLQRELARLDADGRVADQATVSGHSLHVPRIL